MFRISDSVSRFTLKNLILFSDRSDGGGGILDYAPGIFKANRTGSWIDGNFSGSIVNLVSVKDGGKAECLWKFTNAGLILDEGSLLHRLFGTQQTQVKIEHGAILEDSAFDDARCLVKGILKDSVMSDSATLFLYEEGLSENATLKKAFLITSSGTVNGLNVEFGSLCGYEQDCVLNGTISIGGAIKAQTGQNPVPVIGRQSDFVFDLTKRTPGSGFVFSYATGSYQEKIFKTSPGDALIDDMKVFLNARSYTVRVGEDQPPGTYKLAGNAADFNAPVSLKIDSTTYSDALFPGTHCSVGNNVYSLDVVKDSNADSDAMLQLKISESHETTAADAEVN